MAFRLVLRSHCGAEGGGNQQQQQQAAGPGVS